ncbi:MAG: BamA/TamA family outer membrane protein [Thermodesulfobacteriota bacterium]
MMNRYLTFFFSSLLISLLFMPATGFSRPKATVKYSVTRAENPKGSKEFLILPFGFSSETMGPTFGVGGGSKGYIQDQLLMGGAVYGGTEETVGAVLALYDYRPRWADQFFFSIIGSVGHYPKQRAYADPVYTEDKGPRSGTNDSDFENYMESEGTDNWWEMKLEWVLPMGGARDSSMAAYSLRSGILESGGSGGSSWNPMESGITTLAIRQYNHYQTAILKDKKYSQTIHPLEFAVGYNNTDFPSNPSVGSNQYFSFVKDFGWLDSRGEWDFLQFEASKYLSLGASDWARQRVFAFNFWSGHSFSWSEGVNEDGYIERYDAPPHYDGGVLGGFYRMRGYANHRFHDRSVIYSTAEYRYTPRWNPLGQWKLLSFLKVDWMQIVGFVEGGRVAPDYDFDELFSDWKVDGGVGLRFMMAGAIIRFDLGVSDESTNGWLMVGHPF